MQSGQREHRQEHQGDDERGIDDGGADFERGVEDDDAAPRAPGFAEAPEDVFHVDDGVIDDFADGDGQAPERDGVERDAEPVERDDGTEERQRDGRERDERRAEMAEEQEEHHRHEHAAQEQRVLDVLQRDFPCNRRANQAGAAPGRIGGAISFRA